MTILDHLESIITIGKARGYCYRQPTRYGESVPNESESIAWHCSELDALGCPWIAQNKALAYVNDADTKKVWEQFFTRQLREIAQSCLSS